MEAVSPVSGGWLAVADGEYALFSAKAWSQAGLKRRLVAGQWKPIPNWDPVNPNRFAYPFECAEGTWCIADLKQGDVQVLNRPSHPDRILPPANSSGFIYPALPPGRWLYHVQGRDLQLFLDFAWQVTNLDQLRQRMSKTAQLEGLSLDVANAGQDWIGFGLVEHGEERFLRGWCWAPVTSSLGELRCTRFPHQKWPLRNKGYQVARVCDRFFLYYATGNDADTAVAILDAEGRQTHSTQVEPHDWELRPWKQLWQDYPPVWLGTMSVMNDGSLTVSYVGDSVYRVSPSGNVSVLMHPQSMLTPGLGAEAIMVPNGASRSAYIVK